MEVYMSVLVELEKDQLDCLEILAKNKSKDIGHIIAEIVDEYLEDLEDRYFSELSDQILADIRSGKEETIPFEEIKKEYGLL